MPRLIPLEETGSTIAANALSPHGGSLIDRLVPADRAAERIRGLKAIPVRDAIAAECIGIAYGFFSPLEGFMGRADVDSVTTEMRLADGLVWSIPIVLDLAVDEISALGVCVGETFLLTHHGRPLATLDVEEIFAYDLDTLARNVYGTTDDAHPGVRRTRAYRDRFVAGRIELVSTPEVAPPFDRFWLTPAQLRERFAENGWRRVVAFQTRNVPHVGHEWLMKGAFFAAQADGILANPVIGEKKEGDTIDEAIAVTHARLREAGYFTEAVHETSLLLWDMRYAGPREAVFHAIVRKNLGCTHHVFGRDHAGVGDFYDPFAAHRIFDELPDLGIEPVLTQAWSVCELCGPAYAPFCGHADRRQALSGTRLRKLIADGERPDPSLFRPEVFDAMLEAGERYGAGSPFVDPRYLEHRNPVFTLPALEPATVAT